MKIVRKMNMYSSVEKLKIIENLLNIEKNKKNDLETITTIINTYIEFLTIEEYNYLNNKYLNPVANVIDTRINNEININTNNNQPEYKESYSCKRRRLN